jgi:hypothetical protein
VVLQNDRHCSTWPTSPGGIEELRRCAWSRSGSRLSFCRRSYYWVQPWVVIGERTGRDVLIGARKPRSCPIMGSFVVTMAESIDDDERLRLISDLVGYEYFEETLILLDSLGNAPYEETQRAECRLSCNATSLTACTRPKQRQGGGLRWSRSAYDCSRENCLDPL